MERPSFSEVITRLVITLEDLDEQDGHGSVERVDSIEPQPSSIDSAIMNLIDHGQNR